MSDQQPESVSTDDRSPLSLGPTTTAQSLSSGPSGANTPQSTQNLLVNSATGAAGALAGWAFSSLTKQLAATEVHSTLSAQPAQTGATPLPSPSLGTEPSTFGSAPAPRPSATKATFGSTAGSGSGSGMRLGGAKKTDKKSNIPDSLVAEWEDDEGDGEGVANAWGSEDLIDVNADEDDWGESYPISP